MDAGDVAAPALDRLCAEAFERADAALVVLDGRGALARANRRARDLLNLPRAPDAPASALDRAGVAERLGLSDAALGVALRRARGQGAPTPLGVRPPRMSNRDVLCGTLETLRRGRAVQGFVLSAHPPGEGLRGFAHLSDELDARTRDLAHQRAAAASLQAERDRARMVAEVIAEDIGAPAGRVASKLSMILRAPGLIETETARQTLEAVSEECWRLLDTVATVLEHGAREPVVMAGEPVDLAACMGEALSRLRADASRAPAPILALGPPTRVVGDWRLTPLLLQRCIARVAQDSATLRVKAEPRGAGESLSLVFSSDRSSALDARGAALMLSLRDLAAAHGWEAAPIPGPVLSVRLTVPSDRIVDARSGARARDRRQGEG